MKTLEEWNKAVVAREHFDNLKPAGVLCDECGEQMRHPMIGSCHFGLADDVVCRCGHRGVKKRERDTP
jgi:hypothetical protein